ncbi:MAG: hypothetical protein Q9163_003499 [Psora crenata]
MRLYTTRSTWQSVPLLPESSLSTFRSHAFEPEKPYLFPAGTFLNFPAIERWFQSTVHNPQALTLNEKHLAPYGDTLVPLEYTSLSGSANEDALTTTFHRGPAPLALFISWVSLATSSSDPNRKASNSGLYLAQAPLATLPAPLYVDLPVPEFVARAGRGDVYDSSLWLGVSPTYTPLHRDPNPNLFVQLAGRKVVRLLIPEAGDTLFKEMKQSLGGSKGGSKAFRGEEMMMGEEREVLEHVIWGEGDMETEGRRLEAELKAGDGIFIPQGWWHSIKGIGEGVTGSVNWWFR